MSQKLAVLPCGYAGLLSFCGEMGSREVRSVENTLDDRDSLNHVTEYAIGESRVSKRKRVHGGGHRRTGRVQQPLRWGSRS